MNSVKEFLRTGLRRFGLEVTRYPSDKPTTRAGDTGKNHLADIAKFISGPPCVVFDVGANVGQSIRDFKNLMSKCEIHSFEPSPSTFKQLTENVGSYSNVYLNNTAVGSVSENKVLFENTYSDMSSFRKKGELGWGEVVRNSPVNVVTLDQYCDERNISHIDVLKTDTQGYDFEVLKGAQELIRQNRIRLIFMEIVFGALYEGLPPFDEVYRFLRMGGFQLVSFYEFYYQLEMVSWTDALFLNPAFDRTSRR